MTINMRRFFSLKKQEDTHDWVNEKGKHILQKAVVKKAVMSVVFLLNFPLWISLRNRSGDIQCAKNSKFFTPFIIPSSNIMHSTERLCGVQTMKSHQL